MKYFQFLFLFLLMIPINYIYSQTSYLNISLFDDTEFIVQFDGLDYNGTGKTAEFDNLSPGEHFLRVMKDNNNPSSNAYFSGNIKIPANQAIFAVIDEYGTFLIYKKVAYERRWDVICKNDERKNIDNEERKHNDKDKERDKDGCKYKAMKEEDFKDLKKSINNMSFEITNITIVKTAMDKNIVTAGQVRELLNYFTFENNKIEIAKYAYKSTCDKNNYFKIYDAFNFSSSADELKDFISRQKE